MRSLAGEPEDEPVEVNIQEILDSLYKYLQDSESISDWALEREVEISRLEEENQQLRSMLGITPELLSEKGIVVDEHQHPLATFSGTITGAGSAGARRPSTSNLISSYGSGTWREGYMVGGAGENGQQSSSLRSNPFSQTNPFAPQPAAPGLPPGGGAALTRMMEPPSSIGAGRGAPRKPFGTQNETWGATLDLTR